MSAEGLELGMPMLVRRLLKVEDVNLLMASEKEDLR